MRSGGGGINYLVSPAFAEGSTQTLTLDLLSGGRLASEVTNNYILRIPSDFSVKQKGWNDIGSLAVSVSDDLEFNTEKKVVVTASSANEFKLKDGTNEIGYTLTTAEGGTQIAEFTFSAADINTEGGASQDLGISLTWDSTQAAGTYTDTLTYTGAVQDAATGSTVDLSTITGAYTAQDGEVLTGTAGADAHITVAAGATITLKNATITSIPTDGNHLWAGITCAGDATIILDGTSAVKGGYEDYPGIYVPENATLTIKGSGSLTASSHRYGAGIGGGFKIACGNIVIEGGNITATGGNEAAGIGGGGNASCGNITISGGTVSATGGMGAAGIGSGYSNASCGNITITAGVTSVTATKGQAAPNSQDAPNSIGAGDGSTCETVTIGGTVYWNGSSYQNGGDSYLTQSPLTYTPGS